MVSTDRPYRRHMTLDFEKLKIPLIFEKPLVVFPSVKATYDFSSFDSL
jgi:hypothetical protein